MKGAEVPTQSWLCVAMAGLLHKVAMFWKEACGIVSTRVQLLAGALSGNVVVQRRHKQTLKYQVKWISAVMRVNVKCCLDSPVRLE